MNNEKIDVPEVRLLVEAMKRYEAFKERNASVIEEQQMLAEELNQRLEAAEIACRGLGVSCGPIKEMSRSVSWDADGLLSDLGRERFLSVGGQLSTVTKASVDKKHMEASYARGLLGEDVVAHRRKVTIRYKKPNKIVL